MGLQPCVRAERSEVTKFAQLVAFGREVGRGLHGALSVKGKDAGRGCSFPSPISHPSNGTRAVEELGS